MAKLTLVEKARLEKFLEMSQGNVLDFSHRTLAEFVSQYTGKDIASTEYGAGSGSKANRLRAFWQLEPEEIVYKLLSGLLEYRRFKDPSVEQDRLYVECVAIADRIRDTAGSSSFTPDDRTFARIAIEEAKRSVAEDDEPHPKVGAVVVRDGKVLGKAHRGEQGGRHAEYSLLEQKLSNATLAGATLYTTLEPCTERNHPKVPCARRIVERKLKRVVIGTLDPNPKINGRGQLILRDANIVTDLFPNDLMAEVEELNRDFIRLHRTPTVKTLTGISELRTNTADPNQGSVEFAYSEEAKADVDFPLANHDEFSEVLRRLKAHDWFKQGPAIEQAMNLDWSKLDHNQIFVLGRNIYQCADGKVRTAEAVLRNLRRELAKLPTDSATHLLNGMFFEVYFNREGSFRGVDLKDDLLCQLLTVQAISRFEPSVSFIRRELEPFRSRLVFAPSTTPEKVAFHLAVDKLIPPTMKSLNLNGVELLASSDEVGGFAPRSWRPPKGRSTLDQLENGLTVLWRIPAAQVSIDCDSTLDENAAFLVPNNFLIRHPGTEER